MSVLNFNLIKLYQVLVLSLLLTLSSLAFLASSSRAQMIPETEKKDSFESTTEIIGKATQLALQHDRIQATQVLLAAIGRLDGLEGSADLKRVTARAELVEALEKIGKLFFQDQTQQLHEVAQSIRFQNPANALSRLDEALRIEPNNLALLLMRARILLTDKSCKPAIAEIEKASQINPHSEEVMLLIAQGNYCLGDGEKFFTQTASLSENLSKDPFWQLIRARSFYLIGAYGKALEATEESLVMDKGYPEPYYLLALLVRKDSTISIEEKTRILTDFEPASKYLNICSGLSSRARRKYSRDPWLCHTPQIEQVSTNTEVALPNSNE